MAKLNVQGFGELEADLKALLDMPDSIADDILNAEADVVIAAQRKESSQLWNGPYHTGITPKSIKKDKIKDKGGKKRSIMVSPQGHNRKGVRNAEVAFINEYGKRGQPARPAMRLANEKADKDITAAAEKVVNDYMDKHNL